MKKNKSSVPAHSGSSSKKKNDAKDQNVKAHEQADLDIAHDPDNAMHSPNDDLDEGELARLGEQGNPIE